MRFFKQDDGWLDVITKGATVISFGFGIYVYLHTIHPIFQKESELQSLHGEKLSLQKTNESLMNETTKLKADKYDYELQLNKLKGNEIEISNEISIKNKSLYEIKKDLLAAQDEAVISKLNLVMNKIISAYTQKLVQGDGDDFDVIKFSKTMLDLSKKHLSNNIYEIKAYEFFRDYVEKNKENEYSGSDKVIGFAVMLPYTYRLANTIK